MAAFVQLDIAADSHCDLVLPVTILLGGTVFAGLTVASAAFTLRATAADPMPIALASTSFGMGLTFGVAPPSPVGAQCTNLAELEADYDGPPVVQTSPPNAIVATVAGLAALASLAATGFTLGQYAFVQAGAGAYWAWSPGDTRTPDGKTIVASTAPSPAPAGNWLLAPTVLVHIPAASLAGLVGISQAVYDLLVTWADGTVSKILEGAVAIEQSVGP